MFTKFHLPSHDSIARLVALGAVLMFPAAFASAQIFVPLHTFSAASAFAAPLTQGPDGTLYGVSSGGGLGGSGTVFRLNPDGTHFAVLYSFGKGAQFGAVSTNADGYAPVGGLVVSNNVLYGTTKYGGVTGYGTVFKINTDGSGFSTLHFFTNGVSGGTLYAGLVLGGGALYGVAYSGGTNNGTIFTLNTDGTGFTNLHNFGGSNGTFPMASMILSGSTLYGTTQEGGNGTVFKMDTNGANFSVLYHFTSTFSGTNTDGNLPEASLLLSGNTLYGTASGGGRGSGTIFAVNTDGTSFTNLYNFTNGVDGSAPVAALTLSGNTLYGTAKSGGISPGYGTIFSLNTDGSGFTTLYQFPGRGGPAAPLAGLILSGNTLFGTAGSVIFSINTNATNIAILSDGSEGAQPMGGLVLSGDTAYATTSAGGNTGSGTIYQVRTNGTGFDTLYTFSATGSGFTNLDGASPRGTLVLTGGKLYGTANNGGPFGDGTIFCINTNGTGFTNLHSFTNTPDGTSPIAGLVLGGGTLYGTTQNGGTNGSGSIFKINTDGSGYEIIYSFSANSTSNTDGINPRAALVLSGDTLYGSAFSGGTNGSGTLFKITTNGDGFTLLYTFVAPAPHTIDTVNVNGANPAGTLILSGNTLFGTASSGGTGADGKASATHGTIFKINTDGSGFTRLYAFDGSFDGSVPMAGVALSGNLLYGTGSLGGNGGAGTVFLSDTNGSNFTTLHTFPFQGGTPLGDLIVADGVIYGTSEFSVPGSGSVFAVAPTVAPTIQFTATPTSGIPPQAVQFSAPEVDDKGNTILGWYWNFDDGTPTFTITYTTNRSSGAISTNYIYTSTQNPLHTYTNSGTYTPSLIATNNNGTTVLGFGPTIVIAYPTSILNGGFEAGSFTNWTRTGNFANSGISTSALYRHSGTYGAQLFASGTLGYLSQTLSTVPGGTYLVSLWLDITNVPTANEFLVNWGGTTFMDQTNIPKIGWTNIQFVVTATSNTTVLQLGYRNDSAYFGLDDVSVISAQPLIANLSLSGANLVLNNAGGLSNHVYYVLESTNAVAPLNLWTPIATNNLGTNGNFSFTITNAINPAATREFYIIQMK